MGQWAMPKWEDIVKEVRGNALWDAVKWLWAAGGSGVTLAIHWIVGLVRGHQDLTATIIVGLSFIFFGAVAFVIHRHPGPLQARAKTQEIPNWQSLQATDRIAAFHPRLDELGRRIEAAGYGAEGKIPSDVTAKIESLKEGEEIPVNHDELCGGVDPARGRDKFLTVTLSDTLRQGDIYRSPRKWLNGGTELSEEGKWRTWPWPVFTVQEIRPDLAPSDTSHDYDKVRMVLTNATGKELAIWTPVWESAEVHARRPFASEIQLPNGPLGWKSDIWYNGAQCITLPAGRTFMCWIGLLEPSGDGIKQRLKKETTGTAVFPVKIEGRLYEVPIRL